MKIFNKFIESKTEPSNKNDIWFDGNTWNMYKEGEWKPFTVPIEAAEKIKDNLDSLKLFNIVEYLPDVGKDNIIYLLSNKNGSESNSLIEYIYINNKWEEIGSFTPSFDLDGYVKSEDLEKALKNKVDKVVNKGLSSNDYTTAEKQKLASLNNYDDTKLKEEIAETYQPKGNYLTNIPSDYVKKTDLAKINGKPLYNGGNIEITGGEGTSSGIYHSNIEDGDIAMTENYGDFKAGTKVSTLNGKKTYDELFDGILFPTVNPTFVNPSASISWRSGFSFTQEVGANGPKVNDFITSYNAGAINLSGKEQAKRGGTQDTANSFIYVNGNVANRTLPSKVTLGNTTFKYRAAYAQGPQPKNNKGNNFGSPLAAGSVDSGQITLNGTYPWYASTQTAGVLTKQTLIAWNATAGAMQAGATGVGFEVQPHTAAAPQKFKLPRKATSLQMYNTVAKAFETVALSDWDETTSQDTINGNTCTYYTYTYKGDARGSVKLIVKF